MSDLRTRSLRTGRVSSPRAIWCRRHKATKALRQLASGSCRNWLQVFPQRRQPCSGGRADAVELMHRQAGHEFGDVLRADQPLAVGFVPNNGDLWPAFSLGAIPAEAVMPTSWRMAARIASAMRVRRPGNAVGR